MRAPAGRFTLRASLSAQRSAQLLRRTAVETASLWAPTSNSKMTVNRATALLFVAMTTSACTTADLQTRPVPITARNDIVGAAVVRRSIPEASQLPDASVRDSATDTSAPLAGVVVPPNTQYVCVVEKGGVREQTSIEFSAKVAGLCRKHPEMGPCKYERDVCRRGNGARVRRQWRRNYQADRSRVRQKSDACRIQGELTSKGYARD